jgi:hypothetical protein
MKKLLIVLSALVLAVALAVPALAMDMYDRDGIMVKMLDEEAPVVIFHGEMTFGMSTTFDAAEGAIGFSNSYVDVSIWPFEYNAVTIELLGDPNFPTEAGYIGYWAAPYFYLTTDLGAWFDLPVGFLNKIGVLSLYSRKYEVSGHAYERTLVRSNIDPVSWVASIDAGMAMVDFALGFGETDLTGDGIYNDVGFILTVPELGPVDFEAFYLAEDNKDYKGNVGADVKLVGMVPMLDFAGGVMYNLVSENVFYGFGAMLTYDMLSLGASFNGWDEDAINQIGIDAKVDLGGYGLEAGLGLSGAEAADTFQGAEISAWVNPNASTWRAGYIITENGYAYASAVTPLEGGFFITADIDF